MRMGASPRRWAGILAVVLTACTVSRGVKVVPLQPTAPLSVHSAVKAHLKDGSTVVFPQGVTVEGRFLQGAGTRHDLALKHSTPVQRIALEDVAAMESFRTDVDTFASVSLSILATAGVAVAGAFASVVIFGSCPTVYSIQGESPKLEAETFSYSIVSLFESRDLDRLSVDAGPDGKLRLEIRNEALETHYINHLQVLDVRHRHGEDVLPDASGRPLVVGRRWPATRAVSRLGRDVAQLLSRADGGVYRTDPATLSAARAGDLGDWIDVAFPLPADSDEVALVLRARSSLLNTVLFYDVMLAEAGPRSLDWLGRDLERISSAVELGRFCRKYMGLRVTVWRDGAFREIARVPDPGPIAWHDVAVAVPVAPGEAEVRLRLEFLADAWRFDALALAESVRSEVPRILPVGDVRGPTDLPEPAALESLRAPDQRYLQTSPGQRFVVLFDPEPLAPAERRTLLLSSQGYYTEWIRGDWLRSSHPGRVFSPTEEALLRALGRWEREQGSLEARFDAQRVPVR